jgi:hypothetical protein
MGKTIEKGIALSIALILVISMPGRIRKKRWPPINADERRFKRRNSSALVRVCRRPEMRF